MKLSVVTGSVGCVVAEAGRRFSAANVSPFHKKFCRALDKEIIPIDPRAMAELRGDRARMK